MPRILENNIRDSSTSPADSSSSNSVAIMENGRYDQSPDLNTITLRQLREDIVAYKYDLEFCNQQLSQHDLTPQESRTLQLRRLDMGHNIRRCNHRMEILRATTGAGITLPPSSGSNSALLVGVEGNGFVAANPSPAKQQRGIKRSPSEAVLVEERETPSSSSKRARASGGGSTWVAIPKDEGDDDEKHLELKRLGFWRCRLCVSTKYLLAGAGRQPSAPCKWPLKDIAKMITHYMDMHGEHEPDERCKELGDALDKNRGPFEYWLRRSRSQNLEDGSVIDECVETLQAGHLPDVLRRLSRAAAGFPQE